MVSARSSPHVDLHMGLGHQRRLLAHAAQHHRLANVDPLEVGVQLFVKPDRSLRHVGMEAVRGWAVAAQAVGWVSPFAVARSVPV